MISMTKDKANNFGQSDCKVFQTTAKNLHSMLNDDINTLTSNSIIFSSLSHDSCLQLQINNGYNNSRSAANAIAQARFY